MNTLSKLVVLDEESATHVTKREPEVRSARSAQPVWRTSILFTVVTALIFGLAYPLAIAGIAKALFPRQAAGSLILEDGQIVGSSLLAQSFTSDRYFHPRPSAVGYDATNSGGSNLAQTNARLIERIQGEIGGLQRQNPGKPVPIDMVTESASGLDPDITPDNAYYQVPRIAKSRGLSEAKVDLLIKQHIEPRDWGFLGEPRVNVLELNLALDGLASR